MNVKRIFSLAKALDCKKPELRIRHSEYSSCDTYRWTVAVIEDSQTAGPSFAQESANMPTTAEDFLIKQLEKKLDEIARKHEEIAAKARKALQPESDEP